MLWVGVRSPPRFLLVVLIVRGLTTAAGVWVTAAIGMACGGGMYVLAVVSTALVLIGLEAFNYFLHRFDRHRDREHE